MVTEMNIDPAKDSWLSIGEARRILGVSEVTMRQWTNDGQIKVFITPGGHRRYKRSQLDEFMASRRKKLGIQDLVAKLEETSEPHREIATSVTASLGGDALFSEQQINRLSGLGRSILELIIQHVSTPAIKDESMEKARAIGRDFGTIMSEAGLTLSETIRSFTCHRKPTVEGVMAMMRQKEIIAEEILAAVPLIDDVMDYALIAMVEAYQQNSKI
jgi:excisionase family DNA binding protein